MARSRLARHSGRSLARLSDAQLLQLRFRDLAFPRSTGMVAAHMRRLQRELRARGLRLKPHYWFAEEWISPDDVPGIALPF